MVRSEAKRKFGAQLQQALRKYVGSHEGELPSDLSHLQDYFDQPIDDAVLQRYAMLKAGEVSDTGDGYLVGEMAPPVDKEHDSRVAFSLGGTFEQSASANARARGPDRSPEVVWAAMLEQAKVNQGRLSRDPLALGALPLPAARLRAGQKHPLATPRKRHRGGSAQGGPQFTPGLAAAATAKPFR
ncbi:MAG: hypothetical protein AB9869_02890 [Verrucomicrobiia bacterium]